MRSTKRLSSLLMMLLIVVAVCGCGKEQQKPKETRNAKDALEVGVSFDKDYWSSFDMMGTYFQDQQSTANYVINALTEDENLLGEYGWWQEKHPDATKLHILFKFVDGYDSSYTALESTGDSIEVEIALGLNTIVYADNEAELHKQLACMILADKQIYSRALEDGLLEYVQKTIKPNSIEAFAKEHYGVNLSVSYKWTRDIYKEKLSEEDYNGYLGHIADDDSEYPYKEGSSDYAIYNDYAVMFTNYLVENYGMDKYMELIDAATSADDFKKVYDKNLDELKTESEAYYDTLKVEVSMQDVISAYNNQQ